ncbi:hypothetical protein [Roseibium album]|uniref:Uncharacterized protein n=2 Tax=Stappiaceae TaxID=2821832 RepID=A0A0M6ZC13_9HYPH|nr:hypothetical protein [Roseibium album]CTQ59034.1 hypothetical protein LA5094_01800 [Roseibium album]CTQ64003.1 hypothetical protein LA5096_00223 [Roseibium album]CTQ73693.1 hypothetical protein LA5095_02854 [Roseibium album]
MLDLGSVSIGAATLRFLKNATCALLIAVPAIVIESAPLSAQTVEAPMPPGPKPDPNAPSVPREDQIINLLDREPEPLFSDAKLPLVPTHSTMTGFSDGLDQGALYLMAKLTQDSPPLDDGLVWRIYSETTNANGRLELVATANGGDAEFRLDPGAYLVHTAFGYAQSTNRVVIGKEVQSKMLTLNAGGIKFGAAMKDGNGIDRQQVTFDVYGMTFDERGERNKIVGDVKPGSILRLSADTYHVVSRYGDVNAVIRADIQVLPGKLTEATILHKAADITLKLVNERGGEAIANTTWSVLSAGGHVVVEATGAFPDFVLASGEYEALARNNGRTYQHTFEVVPGEDREVEVVTSVSELAAQEAVVNN